MKIHKPHPLAFESFLLNPYGERPQHNPTDRSARIKRAILNPNGGTSAHCAHNNPEDWSHFFAVANNNP